MGGGGVLEFGDRGDSWHRFVRAPATTNIRPTAVRKDLSCGSVSHPAGLLGNADGGPTVLTRLSLADPVPSVVIDFGINLVGFLEIGFAWSERAGDKKTDDGVGRPGVRLAFFETVLSLGERSDFTRSDWARDDGQYVPGTDQIAVPASASTWIDTSGYKVVESKQVFSDGLHGFRYVRLSLDALESDQPYTEPLGRVAIQSVTLRLSAFHGTPSTFTGHFECSDESLTQYWYDAVYTLDLCIDTFRRDDTEIRGAWSPTLDGSLVLHDGAKRDRDPYVGDLAVAGLTLYLSRGPDVQKASYNVLVDLANHQRHDGWIPPASILGYTLQLFDYTLWWVTCSYDWVMYTGDLDYARTYLPHIRKVFDTYYPTVTNPATGLLERGWNETEHHDYAFVPRVGPVTYYNALYIRALRRAAALAELVDGDDAHATAAGWRNRADLVADALALRNIDPAVGAFFDGTATVGGSDHLPTHAQDGNSLAVLERVIDPARARAALAYYHSVAARPHGNAFYDNDVLCPDASHESSYSQRVYAFISYFEIAARFESGLAESALEEARRCFGWMAARDPGSTFWESTTPATPDPFISLAHGWSSGIAPLLTTYVLGVSPLAPGFVRWQVRPHPADLSYARGRVPTPTSQIRVAWRCGAPGDRIRFSLRVDPPRESAGTICVPYTAGCLVWCADKAVYPHAEAGASVAVLDNEGYVAITWPEGGGECLVSVLEGPRDI